MKIIKRILLLVLIVSILIPIIPTSIEAESEKPTIRVLFIGNSKTFRNIFPRMFRHLSEAANEVNVRFETIVAAGRTTSTHANKLEAIHAENGNINKFEDVKKKFLREEEYEAYKGAFSKEWDYVVIQGQTDESADEAALYDGSKRIVQALKKYGKNNNPNMKVIYNAIWAQYNDSLKQLISDQSLIDKTYSSVQSKIGGKISYSGRAVCNYLSYIDSNYLAMYVKDKNHPTPAASYLSACCLYGTIFGKSPVGINYYGYVTDNATNPIYNLSYAKDDERNNENFTGRKTVEALDKNLAIALQGLAYGTIKNDKTAPSIKSLTGNSTNWTKNNVTLTVNAVDSISGLAQKAYSWDGKKTWVKTNTHSVSLNGNYTVYVKDNLGNMASKSITVSNIDKTAPTITSVTGNPERWTKGNVTLTVNANDSLSGLPAKAYSFDGGTTWQAENTKTYTENTNGIVIKVKDNLDNIATYETINITKILIPESISIKTKPNKITYCEGETLDTSGLVLIKKYNDGSQEEVTSGYTFTPITLNTVGTQNIKVTYEGKTMTFEVNVLKVLDTSEYKVENNNIKGTQSKTNIESFKKKIAINGKNTKIVDKNNNELKDTDLVATGTKIKTTVNNQEVTYTIVVTGDTNGDGQADLKDILTINKYRLNKAELIDEYLSAGDVNGDGKVDLKDLLQINKFRLEKINSL